VNLDVVCFGALNVDRLYRVNQIAKADEESEILGLIESPGGSAANAAVGLARLGIKTGYIGKIATGKNGGFLLQSFIQEGINTDGIVVSEIGKSGLVVGFVDQEGERALYLDPGVNNTLHANEVDIEYASVAGLIHLTSFASELPFEAQKILVESLPKALVTLDPGTIYARKGLMALKPLIERCLAVFPSEVEIRLLTGKDYKTGAEILLEEGARIVAAKLGPKGCYVTDGEESHHVEPYMVKAVDSTGAGDAFCAGFIYGLLRNKTLRECGLLGNYVASRTITKMGARNGLPKKKDLPF
jgi:ribokinase